MYVWFFSDITCSTLTSQSPNIFFPTKYLDLQYFNYNDCKWQNHSCHKIKILVITFDRLRPSFNTTGLFSYISVRRNTSKTEKKKSIIVSYDWLSTTNREHHRHSLMHDNVLYCTPTKLAWCALEHKQQSLTNRSDMHFFLGISDCLMMFCKHFFQCSLKPPLLISITSSILPVNEPLLWCYSPVRMLIVHHQEDLTSVLVVGGFIGARVGHSWHAGRPGGRAWGTRGGALLEVQNVDIFVAVFQFPLEVPGTKPSS